MSRGPFGPPTHPTAPTDPTAPTHPAAPSFPSTPALGATVLAMTLGSFVHGALSEIGPADVERMLELDETLFVEHKSNVRAGGEARNVVKAIAAFANTLGGWLLIGVHDKEPTGADESWNQDAGPSLVDTVRDHLRQALDPMPAFEARIVHLDAGPVGVVRVYESADTPHVMIGSGSVYVREVAGDADTANPRRSGGGKHAERAFAATQIRSRAQLLALAARGEAARRRVESLVNPSQNLPLVATGLGFWFETADGIERPRLTGRGSVVVRLVPYTLPARFRGWSTTAEASAATLGAVETLSRRRGLSNTWVTPDPAGASVGVPVGTGTFHTDGAGSTLGGEANVMVDGAGVVGAALHLDGPDEKRRARRDVHDIAREIVQPLIGAAAEVLLRAEVLGRARCQIDLVGMHVPFRLHSSKNEVRRHVAIAADLALPLSAERAQQVAVLAASALARSAGVPAWDPPADAAT